MATISPFASVTTGEQLDDLRRRLRSARLPDATGVDGWSLGFDAMVLRELVTYWAEEFDWSTQEARLNALPRFRVPLDGLDGGAVHVVHTRAADRSVDPLPILLTHGWPDSSWRYTAIIDRLTDPAAHGGDPADAFDVIVPDLPGFGWSDVPARPLDAVAVAGLWAELMTALGYDRFVAAGGDLGSHVSRFLALDHPDRVIAVHRMDAGLPRGFDPAQLSADEQDWLAGAARWGATEGAYAALHSTKPQTAAAGLVDSPVGLLAWIGEKLHAWSGDGLASFDRDAVLTNVMIYWLTGTITSSMRMYAANAAIPIAQFQRRVEVPSGFAIFGGDVVRPPRAWLERTANLVHHTEPPRGGHFAPVEQPDAYVADLRTFARLFR